MAAGLGYIEFTTGDVLTAASANGYLASQVVMVFADAAARTTAITSPQEGMISFLKDTNAVEAYDGAAWVGVGGGSSPLTTKGDLYTFSTTDARLPVGTDGHTLVADSVEATGLKWVAPSGGSSFPAFFAYRATTNQSISSATWTKVQFNAESFDTDSCYDPSTNYRFTPNQSGYYQINATLYIDTSNDGNRNIFTFYKNGSAYAAFQNNIRRGNTAGELGMGGSTLMYFNGSTDYVEIYMFSTSSSTLMAGQADTMFSGIGIRS
jgi:hypothetical protein